MGAKVICNVLMLSQSLLPDWTLSAYFAAGKCVAYEIYFCDRLYRAMHRLQQPEIDNRNKQKNGTGYLCFRLDKTYERI